MDKARTKVAKLALSLEEAAWELSVSTSFLRLEIARGRLTPVRLGRRLLISVSEVDRYLAEHVAMGEEPTDSED